MKKILKEKKSINNNNNSNKGNKNLLLLINLKILNLVLLFWGTVPHVLRQTDHSMIIEPPLGVQLFSWPNYEWIVFHTALLKVAVSPFLEILNLEVILMRQMDSTINNWVVSLWDICGFPWAKCL